MIPSSLDVTQNAKCIPFFLHILCLVYTVQPHRLLAFDDLNLPWFQALTALLIIHHEDVQPLLQGYPPMKLSYLPS